MAAHTGTSSVDNIDVNKLTPSGTTTPYWVTAGGGNDTVYGGSYDDFLFGEAGSDTLYGRSGNDALIGDAGNDYNDGGAGNDDILDGAGNDTLLGGTGNDKLWGSFGNDKYIYRAGDGLDVINDNKNATGAVGGGGLDTLEFRYHNSEISFDTSGNDLYVTTVADLADGIPNFGVKIENQLLGSDYKIEQIMTLDGLYLMPI